MRKRGATFFQALGFFFGGANQSMAQRVTVEDLSNTSEGGILGLFLVAASFYGLFRLFGKSRDDSWSSSLYLAVSILILWPACTLFLSIPYFILSVVIDVEMRFDYLLIASAVFTAWNYFELNDRFKSKFIAMFLLLSSILAVIGFFENFDKISIISKKIIQSDSSSENSGVSPGAVKMDRPETGRTLKDLPLHMGTTVD